MKQVLLAMLYFAVSAVCFAWAATETDFLNLVIAIFAGMAWFLAGCLQLVVVFLSEITKKVEDYYQ